MNSYFLCITQPTNLGDLIINKMLVMELAKHGKVFVDCKNTPKFFSDYLLEGDNVIDAYGNFGVSVKSCSLLKLFKLARAEKISIYVSSPGPAGEGKQTIIKRYLKFIGLFFKFMRIEHFMIGNCLSGALADGRSIQFANIKHAYIRSKNSVSLMNNRGYRNISYIPDLAFLMKQYANVKEKKKIVVMSFRKTNVDSQDFVRTLSSIVELLLNEGFFIEFYYQVEADKIYNETLAKGFEDPKVSFHKDKIWYNTLDFYSDKMFVISNRLHSLLTGAVYDLIPFAIVDDSHKVKKIEDVFESSFSNADVYIYNSNNESNMKLKYLIDNYASVKKILMEEVNNNCNSCKLAIEEISKDIETHIQYNIK